MKNALISGFAALFAVAVAAPAFAADMKVQPRRTQNERTQNQAQNTNWSGSQAGGSNGVSSVNNNFVEPGAFNFFGCSAPMTCYETPFDFNNHRTSYIISGFVGYRLQFGNFVVGIEGDVAWKEGETSQSLSAPPPWLQYEQFNGSLRQGIDGSVRGRLGFLLTPTTLIYGTGGVAIGEVSGDFSYQGCSLSSCGFGSVNVTGSGSWSDTRVGYTVGGGAEQELFPGVKLRIEYRYTDLGSYSKDIPLSYTTGCNSTMCGTSAHIDLNAVNHRVLVGIGFDL